MEVVYVEVVGGTTLVPLPNIWYHVRLRSKVNKIMDAYLEHLAANHIILPARTCIIFKVGSHTLQRNVTDTVESVGLQGVSHWSTGPTPTSTISVVVRFLHASPPPSVRLRTRRCLRDKMNK